VKINGKMLDDAKVAGAQKNFEGNRTHGNRDRHLIFGELLSELSLDCCSFVEIGRKHGVTREAIRLIYNRYFRDLFPGDRSGMRRIKVCTLKRQRVVAQDFSIGDVEPWVQSIVVAATNQGLLVCRSKINHPAFAHTASLHSFKKRELLINGKHCRLSLVTSMRRSAGRRRRYSPVRVQLSGPFEFVVVFQKATEDRIFILPVKDIRERYTGQEFIYIFLPVERGSPYNTVAGRVGWFQYENAWHLLRAKHFAVLRPFYAKSVHVENCIARRTHGDLLCLIR